MAVLATIVALPLLLVLSLPLAFFAIFTTTLAFWALLFRASLLYFELLSALLRAYIAPPSSSTEPVHLPVRKAAHKKQTSSTTSLEPPTRLPTRSESFASLIGTPVSNRDFETVGGWRDPGSPAEEATWLAMNSRLDLPASRRHHQRSLTGGSAPVVTRGRRLSGAGSPLLGRTTGRKSGTASPESYFSVPALPVNSSRVSFGDMSRRRRSSSSGSSGVSLVSMNLSRVRPVDGV